MPLAASAPVPCRLCNTAPWRPERRSAPLALPLRLQSGGCGVWGGGGWKGDCQRRLKWTGQGSPVCAVTTCSPLSLSSTLVSQTSLLLPILLSLPWCRPLAAPAWAVSQPLPCLQSPSCCEPEGTFQPLNLTMPLPASNSALAHTLGPSGSTSL